jgi:hypothetical protein
MQLFSASMTMASKKQVVAIVGGNVVDVEGDEPQ